MSPHLQVWRWHPTMLTSILHRTTGVALYIAAFGVVGWLMAAALGPATYNAVDDLIANPLVQAVLLLAVFGLGLHLASGVRHLLWDFMNIGWSPKAASTGSWVIIGFAVVATAVVAYFGYNVLGGA
jgi:succinate dehydrogenase / fumarate reductase, cytochrome b subunit